MEKALGEAVRRILEDSIAFRTQMLDPLDMKGLQALIADKRRLEAMGNLQISLD